MSNQALFHAPSCRRWKTMTFWFPRQTMPSWNWTSTKLKYRTFLKKHREWLTQGTKPAQDKCFLPFTYTGTTKALQNLRAHQGGPELSAGSLHTDGERDGGCLMGWVSTESCTTEWEPGQDARLGAAGLSTGRRRGRRTFTPRSQPDTRAHRQPRPRARPSTQREGAGWQQRQPVCHGLLPSPWPTAGHHPAHPAAAERTWGQVRQLGREARGTAKPFHTPDLFS